MRSHAMTPKFHVSRLRHALIKLMQATATSTDPYVLDAHKTAREVLDSLNGTQQTLAPIYKSDDLSPTGRKPSQPEYQSLRPSSFPKWECRGDSTPRQHSPTVSVPGMFGDLSRYNKDRTPAEVYKATAEQVINQSRSYPSNPLGKSVSDMLGTEWVHTQGDVVTAYVPAEPGSLAVFSVGRMFLGRLAVSRMTEGPAAVSAAQEYLIKLHGGAQ